MALTPEEEKQLREEIRARLERRLEQSQLGQDDSSTARQAKLEERLRQQIREEEEEKFYTERGFVKYVNHRGGIEWLTPEAAEHRRSKRRTKRGSSRRKHRKRSMIMRWALNIGALGVAMVVFLYLWRYNPIRQTSTGSLVIQSDVPGAHIFINGVEKRDFLTPDTLPGIGAGAYFVSVYKEGYAAWPPMMRVQVEKGKTAISDFELKSIGLMGKIRLNTNVPDVDLYVDGIKMNAADLQDIEIPVGYHVITVVKNGYLASPLFRRVLVTEDTVSDITFTLEKSAEIGYLSISSNRASGFVYISDQFTGIKANGQAFPVREGVYEVRLQENGYTSLPVAELVRITAGETHELAFHLQPVERLDTLNLQTTRPGANIILNGKQLPYLTPMPELLLSEGINYINFIRDGQHYAEKDIPVDLSSMEDRRLVIDF